MTRKSKPKSAPPTFTPDLTVPLTNPLEEENPAPNAYTHPADYLPLISTDVENTPVIETWRHRLVSKDAWSVRAKKFVELVEEKGLTPPQAAKELGTQVQTIAKERGAVEDEVRQIIESYGGMAPEVRRLLARATQNKIMLDALNSDQSDFKQRKLALEASRAISEDIEVGIVQQKPAPPPTPVSITLPPGLLELSKGLDVPALLEAETEEPANEPPA